MVLFRTKLYMWGEEHEFGIQDSERCSRISLLKDAKALLDAGDLDPKERYKVEVKLPWTKSNMVISNDDELQVMFKMFESRGIEEITFVVEQLPLEWTDWDQFFQANPFERPSVNQEARDDNDSDDADYIGENDSGSDDSNCVGDNEDDDDGFWEESMAAGRDGVKHGVGDGVGGSNVMREREKGKKPVTNYMDNCDSDRDEVWSFTHNNDDNPVSRLENFCVRNQFQVSESGKVEFRVGQTFDGVQQFRKVLRDYCVEQGIAISRIKNEKAKLSVKCAAVGCNWRIYASQVLGTDHFQIKLYEAQHSCIKLTNTAELTSAWIAKYFADQLRSNPSLDIKVMQTELKNKFGLQPSKQKVYRAKLKALEMIGEDHSHSYDLMHRYANALLQSNPNNKAVVWADTSLISATPKFNGVFVSFYSQKKGFVEGCRPLIGLDGCHLKGTFGGVLLAAVSLDANNGVFPIAMAVCEVESFTTWHWFLGLLGDYIGGVDAPDMPLCFMLDRQKGLMPALTECWPHAGRRYCAMHIYQNFRKKSTSGQIRKLFFRASKATNRPDFIEKMKEIEVAFPTAYEYISKIPPLYWSRHAFDTRIKNDHVTNNMSESFNAWIDETRSLPVLTMLEDIRRKIMNQTKERFDDCQTWETEFPPNVMSKLRENGTQARLMTVVWGGNLEFEVVDHGRVFLVNLENHSCSCGAFQVSGIPCKHTMGCINDRRLNPNDYVAKILDKNHYALTYSEMIRPVPDKREWPEVQCNRMDPPATRRKAGRPKTGRKRAPDEQPPSRQRGWGSKCSICREFGHNKRSCTEKTRNASVATTRGAAGWGGTARGAEVLQIGSSQPPPVE